MEAVLGEDAEGLRRSRRAVYEAMGEAALVDAAGAAASFNSVVKVADGAGIELEDFKEEATASLRAELGIEELVSRHHAPR